MCHAIDIVDGSHLCVIFRSVDLVAAEELATRDLDPFYFFFAIAVVSCVRASCQLWKSISFGLCISFLTKFVGEEQLTFSSEKKSRRGD